MILQCIYYVENNELNSSFLVAKNVYRSVMEYEENENTH